MHWEGVECKGRRAPLFATTEPPFYKGRDAHAEPEDQSRWCAVWRGQAGRWEEPETGLRDIEGYVGRGSDQGQEVGVGSSRAQQRPWLKRERTADRPP